MLQIAMTYETTTPESIEAGDADECGFVFESADCSARELARYITREGFATPSCSRGVPRWLTCDEYRHDYCTGETESRSIHPGEDAQSQRVWARVLRITGIVKD